MGVERVHHVLDVQLVHLAEEERDAVLAGIPVEEEERDVPNVTARTAATRRELFFVLSVKKEKR